ncbi:MAG: hypothetical protein M3Y80_10360 [Verrucomicrobiota bacterium]|nr:hypothetical protein [Verrucomicrobiota bacterium]
MTDPVDPIPPTNPASGSAHGSHGSSTGLPSNVAAALACIPLVGGIIFYVLEKHDRFVRFYAMQSIIFGGAWMMFNIVYRIVVAVFASIPAIGGIFVLLFGLVWAVVTIGLLIVFLIAVVKAFTGVRWDIPYVGPIARNQVDGTSTL